MKSAVRQRHGDTAAPRGTARSPRSPPCSVRPGPLGAAGGTAEPAGAPLLRAPGVRLSCGSSGAARAAGGSRLAGGLRRSCTRHKCRHREKRLLCVCVSVSSTLLFFFFFPLSLPLSLLLLYLFLPLIKKGGVEKRYYRVGRLLVPPRPSLLAAGKPSTRGGCSARARC